MENHMDTKEEENSEDLKEERTPTPDSMEDIKDETKEQRKEKEREYSLESVTYVERKDIVRDSVPRKDRKEEIREQERAKDSKVHAMYVEYLATVPTTVGTMEKEKEEKEEHMRWICGEEEHHEEYHEEEEEQAGCVEEACAWGGSLVGDLGGCHAVGDDVEMADVNEKIEMIVDSGCRRTIVRPKAFKGMKVKRSENVGKNFTAANGAHIPNQGETIITGKDAGGNNMRIIAQVADVTKNLASVMEMVDRGNWVIFHKDGGYIQTVKKDEDLKMRTLMNTLKGTRVPIERKGNNFVLEISVKPEVDRKEGEYIAPKKLATKKLSNMRKMDVDEGKTLVKNKFGALSMEDEQDYEAASAFAGQGW